LETFILIVIVVTTNFLSAVTGFGGNILAMPFVISLVGIEVARPLLMVTALIQPCYITISLRKYINWKVLRTIVLVSGLGLPLGIWLYQYLPQNALLISLGVIMVLASGLGFMKLNDIKIEITSKPVLLTLLFLGGIVQGALLSGGPLIVIYTAFILKDKMSFRVTLSALWTILYTVTIIQGLYSKNFTIEIAQYLGIIIPLLIGTVGLANLVAKKLSERVFGYVINITLCIGGVITIINQIT